MSHPARILAAIDEGRKILDVSLIRAGFKFVSGSVGKGSGGHAGNASYTNGDRRLDFSYRYALGCVTYHIGSHSLEHNDYMRFLGVYPKSEYSRFSREEPLAGFHALQHDLDNFCSDFLYGPGEEFCQFAEQLISQPDRFSGPNALKYVE